MPLGYGATVVALPVFAVSGAVDAVWHTVLGIETSTDIFFSPSHLGLFAAMVVILTSPLRSAWGDPDLGPRPSMRALLPAVLGLALTTSLVLLFLTYGNALLFFGNSVVTLLSTLEEGGAEMLAARIVLTDLVLLAPLLLLARRWPLPPGAATVVYLAAATVSGTLTGFENVGTLVAIVAAGVGVDVLARFVRPTAERRVAFVAFAAPAPLVTWSIYLAVASVEAGRLPAVTEMWTGIPIVAALIGSLLALLMVPPQVPGAGTRRSRPRACTSRGSTPSGGGPRGTRLDSVACQPPPNCPRSPSTGRRCPTGCGS